MLYFDWFCFVAIERYWTKKKRYMNQSGRKRGRNIEIVWEILFMTDAWSVLVSESLRCFPTVLGNESLQGHWREFWQLPQKSHRRVRRSQLRERPTKKSADVYVDLLKLYAVIPKVYKGTIPSVYIGQNAYRSPLTTSPKFHLLRKVQYLHFLHSIDWREVFNHNARHDLALKFFSI